MSAEDRGARAVAADFIDAFNQADWERFRSQLADDAVYEEAGTGRRVEGADPYGPSCVPSHTISCFDGDRIAEVHHHLDVLALLEQVGALPTPGG